jgi:small nuclear ribonucleoprotein G
VQLNGSRKVIGVLRGYDVQVPNASAIYRRSLITLQVFLNIVLDDAFEEKNGGEKVKLGMVVSIHWRVVERISSSC